MSLEKRLTYLIAFNRFLVYKKGNDLGIFNKNEFSWLKENNINGNKISIKIGIINKKLIYVSPNNNTYCCKVKKGNLLLILNKEIENLEIKQINLNINLNNEINFIPKYLVNKSNDILIKSDKKT